MEWESTSVYLRKINVTNNQTSKVAQGWFHSWSRLNEDPIAIVEDYNTGVVNFYSSGEYGFEFIGNEG